MILKDKLEDYTEAEFLAFLEGFYKNTTGLSGDAYSAYSSERMRHFEKITEHPRQRMVLTRPINGREDSPKGALDEIKEWRQANGKPGFKAE
ncbi:bacteriocin immunity protein [Pseudomonas fluorescens]|nr:bacteriocin immunity protein [Pseudomonas fluorescens]